MAGDSLSLNGYAGRSALVFGSTGFIGGHVARMLAACGARLTLAVRDLDRAESVTRDLAGPVDVIECDVLDHGSVVDTLARARPDVTFNLAAYGVDRRDRDEDLAHRVNAAFPAALCDAIATAFDGNWHGAPLVHVGTQLEYGPLREIDEAAVPAPDTMYGMTKLAGTRALERCAAGSGLKAVTARLFTVYGPGEPAGRLLPTLIDAAAAGAPVDLTSGTQETDFVYVEDVAEGLLRLGVSPVVSGEVVNLATGTLTSVRSFVLYAARILGIPPERLRFGARPQRAETMRYEAVIPRRLKRCTGWTPTTTVAAGIRKTVHRHGLTHASE